MINSIMRLMIIILGFVSYNAFADCQFSSDSPITGYNNYTMPLMGGSITAGTDLPDGSVIFRQTFRRHSPLPFVTCTGTGNITTVKDYTTHPLPLSSWGGNPFGGNVYETGVPGIGVVYWYKVVPFPYTLDGQHCSESGGNNKCELQSGDFDIQFIKTGPISSGVIQGANLPCMKEEALSESGGSLKIHDVCLTGSLNVVAATCTTPDVNVTMDSWDINNFKGVGSATDWKDASINLINCPVFHGTLNDDTNTYVDPHTNDSGVGNFSKNSFSVKFIPAASVINNTQGIFSLNSTSNSATGVGIQLVNGNPSSATASNPVTFNTEIKKDIDLGYSGNIKIPLSARYIQTDPDVTPGMANGAVTFLINYY
ncbi:TPA: hypothetical protein M9Z22_004968 [Klebsiella pneumoniae subsp. pneumoniae]|nr:hypothetical protein [Klebsiella pneumoniae subsp. pneumoniae]